MEKDIESRFQDIIPAIAAYETQMRNRGAEAANRSFDNTKWMHSEKKLLIQCLNCLIIQKAL